MAGAMTERRISSLLYKGDGPPAAKTVGKTYFMAEVDCMEKTSLADAVGRLEKAVGHLETAVQRRMDADRSLNALQDDLQRLGEDRSQLAASLDESEARASRLEEANKDVSRRLVSAMETIRSVLDAHGG
ncbi:MAG: hypothetical protein Tsb0019_28740 [Roseibium sp.]